MKAKIFLGGYYEKGSSIIEMELNKTEKGYTFSASGLYNYQFCPSIKDWDFEGGGQCLDTIAKDYPKNKEVQLIVKLWRKYHLNDMNAGSPRQTEYLRSLGEYQSYDWACEELEKVDLLHDKEFTYPQQLNGYRYGSAWLYREIPQQDIETIKEIINNHQIEHIY